MSYSDNMVEPGAIVEALNKETEYTTKKHKLKKKYKKKLKKAYRKISKLKKIKKRMKKWKRSLRWQKNGERNFLLEKTDIGKKHPSRCMAKGNPVYVISSNDQFMRYLFGNYAGKEVIDAQYREVEGAK